MKDTEKLENVFETDGDSFETTATKKEDSPTKDQNTKGESPPVEVDEKNEESPVTEKEEDKYGNGDEKPWKHSRYSVGQPLAVCVDFLNITQIDA